MNFGFRINVYLIFTQQSICLQELCWM